LSLANVIKFKLTIIQTMEWNELVEHSKILQILKEKDEKLFNKVKEIREIVKPILKKTNVIFPEYTLHNVDHSDEVVKNFDVVIPEELMQEMNKWELFFLVVSAYLHDIGMAFDINPKEYDADKEFEEFRKKFEGCKSLEEIKREFIREYHHIRSKEYVEKCWKDLKLDDHHQAEIIGRICMGHRKVNLSNRKMYPPEVSYKDVSINTPLLAMFLRIADELDVTFVRAPLIVFETLEIKNPKSKEEWEKHLSVSGVARSEDDPLKIIVSVPKCTKPEIHRKLKSFETKVQKMLWELPEHLHHYRNFVNQLPTRIYVDIKPEGYEAIDVKFRLNERLVLTLLKDYVYGEDKFSVVIRELLQNSIDACRRALDESKRRGRPLRPENFEIVFEIQKEDDKWLLIVRDNGYGIEEFVIRNYLGYIGESFYHSDELKSKGYSFSPVSRFGLGLLSYFLIADKVEILTRAENESNGWMITINDVFDYFFYQAD